MLKTYTNFIKKIKHNSNIVDKININFPISIGFTSFLFFKQVDERIIRFYILSKAIEKNHPDNKNYFDIIIEPLLMD